MIALREKARMPRPEERGWTAKMAFSLEEAPCGPTTSVGGSTGFFTQAGEARRGKDVWPALARVEGGNVFFLKMRM